METVVICSDPERSLAFVAKEKSWVIIVQGHQYSISDDSKQSKLAVLPFLELSVVSFERRVSEFLAQYPGTFFPYEFFIRAGFEHGSPHWTECSLRWLLELGLQPDKFSEELESVANSTKRYSQKSRQLAKRLMKVGRTAY